jgi:branched-subunit amino acid ABC-type transport system permease component
MMETYIFFALLGVGTGAMYGAFAVSLIITYRGCGVVNFATGAMAMFPTLVFVELRSTGDLVLPLVVVPSRFSLGSQISFFPALLIALTVGSLLAAVIYVLVIRPLRSSPPVTMMVATVGLALAIQGVAVKSFGNVTVRGEKILPDHVIELFGRPFPVDRLWILAAVLFLTLVVAAAYRLTRFGLATRAAFLNEKGALLLGLEPARLGFYNWVFASLVASTIGILGSSLGGVSPFSFSLFVVPALGAALAGRLRSVAVGIGAAVAIGSFEAVAVHIVSRRQVPSFLLGGFSSLVPFVVIIGALILVGRTLPNRAALTERAQVRVVLGRPKTLSWALMIFLGIVVLSSDDATIRFATIQSLFVTTLLLSIVVLTGYLGQVSLAQLSFAGFSAFMLSRFDSLVPFPFGPLLAILLTIALGTLVSVPALRVSFSIAVVFDDVLFRSPTFVGVGGLAQVERPRLFGLDLGIFGEGQFPDRRFGFIVLAGTVVCAAFVALMGSGGLGRRFLAVRSNERAAAAAGISVPRTKIIGAAFASGLAGVAGVMFAYKSVTFNGGGLDAQRGLELLALCYLGGIGSISGAVIGGLLAPSGLFIVAVLGGGSSTNQYLLTGLGLVLVAVKFPRGLAGLLSTMSNRLKVFREGGKFNEPKTPTTVGLKSSRQRSRFSYQNNFGRKP